MGSIVRRMRLVFFSVLLLVMAGLGCGGRGNSVIVQPPIAVPLPISTVVVSQDGMQVLVPIQITSTSETALVAVQGLPTGVQVRYAASDTNPSGSLAFTATSQSPEGTHSPTVTVNSAGQTASTNFTLIITATAQTGNI